MKDFKYWDNLHRNEQLETQHRLIEAGYRFILG